MKKIILSACVLVLAITASKAQTTNSASKDGGKISIGVEAGLPLGNASDYSSLAIGGSLKYEYPLGNQLFVTLSGGYTDLLYKSEFKDELSQIGISKSGEGFIPVKAGLKYYFSGGFFGEAQAGATFSTESGGGTAFAYAPGIGYTLTNGLEAGVRFEGWSHDGSLNQAALRVAYLF